jgi:hypothetical protein
MSLRDFRINESEEFIESFDNELLDELVELVGSEEDVEAAAKEAHEDLLAASENDEVEMTEEDVPENLAIAALIIKLVEMGSISPEDGDGLIEKYLS